MSIADVLAHHRLDHCEHQHQEGEGAGDCEHRSVLTREPASGEIRARRRVHEFADLAGHPDGGVRDPFGDAAHHDIRRPRAATLPAALDDGPADVADHR